MSLPSQIQSDIVALVATLPTVKEAVMVKQGLRLIRDEMLYRSPKDPLQAHQTDRLQQLGLSSLLLDWISSPEGNTIFDDIKSAGPDSLLQAYDTALKQVELIQVSLAYQPSVDDASRFHKWFNQVLNRPIMLDIRFNPQLLAGISFVYQNRLYNYSLSQRLPELEQDLLQRYQSMMLNTTPNLVQSSLNQPSVQTPSHPQSAAVSPQAATIS